MSKSRILVGDVRESLRGLPDGSVRCVVTSPPYWGLRDYGHDGQLGLERTPDEYVQEMVGVFREVRRVLADDGTLWLNLGDTYSVNHVGRRDHGTDAVTSRLGPQSQGFPNGQRIEAGRNRLANGLKPKELVGIPWRVAFALQADGWYLRQDIIWAKPNPMPESVTDRCTKAHEYVFLLTKQPRYYYDNDAVREPHAPGSYEHNQRYIQASRDYHSKASRTPGQTPQTNAAMMPSNPLGRNRRSVWTVTTKPFRGAHFAVMPEALVEPCILAGSAPGDTVLDPFSGSGTVGVVALKHERNYIGCELNPEYADLSRKRICDDQPLMNTVRVLP